MEISTPRFSNPQLCVFLLSTDFKISIYEHTLREKVFALDTNFILICSPHNASVLLSRFYAFNRNRLAPLLLLLTSLGVLAL